MKVTEIRGKTYNLIRAPLWYFYNAPHWGGGYFEPPPPPPSDLRNYWTDSKIQAEFESPGKTVEGKKIDLVVTSDVTGQVKVKMFDFSGLVTSASKTAMLTSNRANESAWIVSLTFVSLINCAL